MIEEPIRLLDPDSSIFNTGERIYHNGIELEKGVVITEEWLQKNEDLFYDCWEKFTVYPDVYLDLITPLESNFKLFPYQRIFLRAAMRYTNIYITAARGTSKSFLSILAKVLQCTFIPNHVGSIVAPNVSQAAKIGRQKLEEIFRTWPLLEKELEIQGGKPHVNYGKDYIEAYFKNGSVLKVVGALDSSRGLRTHATLLDEVRDLDGQMVQEVILPQMDVSRRQINGLVNPYERINTQVICATSAGMKSSFAYEMLLDFFQKAIIDPHSSFVMGLDYRIPTMHGLLDKNYIEGLKLSPSYDEQTFGAEYCGQWLGGSDESWFNYEKLQKYRKIKNPEKQQKYIDDPNVFYLLSVNKTAA